MKRFAFSLLASLALILPVSGQVLFHDDFQNIDINRFSVGDPDASWTLYNDNNEPSVSTPDFSHFDKAWNVYLDNDGSMQAASVSFFRRAGTADRWMVSPSIDLSSTQKPVLVFRARAMDAQNRDGFAVKLSVSGIEKSDFTVDLQTTRNAPNAWTYYDIDLSAYKGESVHLAFVQNSSDKYMICIDDIAVFDSEAESALMTAVSAPASIIMPDNTASVTANAVLFNTGSEPIVSYTLCQRLDNGEVSRTEVSNVDIAPLKPLSLTAQTEVSSEGQHTLFLWAENINGKDISSNIAQVSVYSIRNASLPRKNFLLEIFSSGMCSSCAPWNAVLHPFFIQENANAVDNSGNFSVVKYQVNIPSAGDPTVTAQSLARCDYYGVNFAPCFYMNGRLFSLSDTGTVFRSFRDSIASFRQRTVPTGLKVSLERNENTFKVHATVTNYLTDADDYYLVVCLIEDSMHHIVTMHNGEKDFYNVMRQMLPDHVGTPVSIETRGGIVEKDFEYTFNESSPTIYSSVENMGAVVFLQSRKNNQVSQAFYLAPGHSAAIEDRTAFKQQLSLYPNPVNDRCSIVFEALSSGEGNLQIIDNQGKIVRDQTIGLQQGRNTFFIETSSLGSGMYFVRIRNNQGVFTHKMIKR
ncbi:MAG: choice-of-anchor J domain-containing protein [Bacteroidales bacterium]|nr:choice-of-anchor J domain-containing protein [Bacteroidales bacterium]MDE7072270.1 choice-of-anchor J domain-containing protein [Bacteroidales bacterium]